MCLQSHRVCESKKTTNGLERRFEVLETIVIEMAKKLVKLEAELKDIKDIQTQSEITKEN